MKNQKESRRNENLRLSNQESNRLTRECLQTALIYLMNEKPFEQIHISELARRSGVSRTAFYRNYTCKEDILAEISNAFVQEVAASFLDERYRKDSYGWFCKCFSMIRENAGQFRLLLQAHMPRDALVGVGSILEKWIPADSPADHYRLLALEGAFINILADWLRSGMTESVEDMAHVCNEQLGHMIHDLFESQKSHTLKNREGRDEKRR